MYSMSHPPPPINGGLGGGMDGSGTINPAALDSSRELDFSEITLVGEFIPSRCCHQISDAIALGYIRTLAAD